MASTSARATLPRRTPRSIVGRDREIESITAALSARGRWITLTGPAGVGKTRLALEISRRWIGEERASMWVDLEACRDLNDLLHAVAWAFGEGVDATEQSISEALSACGPLLLVLDDADRLGSLAAESVSLWARGARELRICLTCRQPLGASEEEISSIEPFPPPLGDPWGAPGWQLMLAAAPQGALDGTPPEATRALLQRLDGLPLAIELAAARLEVLGVEALIERLSDPMAVLIDPDRPDSRRGALMTAIALSWESLSDEEREILGQIAAFVSPVAEEHLQAALGRPVAGAVQGLIRQSMLLGSDDRIVMLPSTRAFVRRALSRERQGLFEARHAEICAEIADVYAREFALDDRTLLAQAKQSASELAAVIDRARSEPSLTAPAVRCALALVNLMLQSGAAAAQLGVVEAVLSLDLEPKDHAWARWSLAVAMRRLGRLSEARQILVDLVEAEPVWGLPNILAHLCDIEIDRGDEAAAEAALRHLLSILDEHPSWRMLESTALSSLASLVYARDPREAEAALERARLLTPRDRPKLALELRKTEAWIYLELRDPRAEPAYREVLEIARELGHERTIAFATGNLGITLHNLGRPEGALPLLTDAAARMRALGDPVYSAYYLSSRGAAELELGRAEEALADCKSALAAAIPSQSHTSHIRTTLALALARLGSPVAAQAAAEVGMEALVSAIAGAFSSPDDREVLARARVAAEGFDGDYLHGRILARMTADIRLLEDSWRIRTDGAWFETPEGARALVTGNRANRRILAELGRRRVKTPGQPVGTDDLTAAGWPSEQMSKASAQNRVRVALSGLRGLGLGPLLRREREGWLLDPDTPLRLVEG